MRQVFFRFCRKIFKPNLNYKIFMINYPRVALFADTYHEINGAANVIRRLTDFARQNGFPFFCIRAGEETKFTKSGQFQILELKRNKLSFPIDGELKYDPFLWRYKKLIREKLKDFQPDVVHLTGLNDVSQIGFYHAHYDQLPAVASWHTNTHEYAARRLLYCLRWLPQKMQNKIESSVEKTVMAGLMRLYHLAQVQLAPNNELVEQIQTLTHRPSFLMSRGVDTEFLHPRKRTRQDTTFILGFVGRLRPEKNIRYLAQIEKSLKAGGITDYKFVLVGEGSEAEWLKDNLSNVELKGVLRGELLAETYANMDLFVFPSRTDAFGNVVLEAMAAGVPAIVMPEGGPKFLIENGVNGFVAWDEKDFFESIAYLVRNPGRVAELRQAARTAACRHSWQRVFEGVYDKYHLSTKVGKKVRI